MGVLSGLTQDPQNFEGRYETPPTLLSYFAVYRPVCSSILLSVTEDEWVWGSGVGRFLTPKGDP